MPKAYRLFAITRLLLKAAEIFVALIVILFGLALGALFVASTNLYGNHLGIPAMLPHGIARTDAMKIGYLVVIGVLLSFTLIFFAVRAVAAIVQTAISGDPFVNDNARRLTRIGALLVALVAIELATSMAVNGTMKRLADAHHVPVSAIGGFTFGPDLSPIGLFAILLIFVLAQIFRRGSEMRAELEGTV
jgi:hypothetical protein